MSAFERGWMDAEVGRTIRENPYHRQSGEAIAWRAGYRAFLEAFGLLHSEWAGRLPEIAGFIRN